jgi:Ca-activated chloride channel homolog
LDWLWPDILLLLWLLPLLIALYVVILRRRYRFAVRYSSLSLLHLSVPQRSFLKRHLAFILFLAALTGLVLAMARPIVPEAILSGRTTIILTLDVSRSMCMRDILPNRLSAAKASALSFVEQPVLGTQIGIVAFSGFAELAQRPTTEQSLLKESIANLTTSTRTAIGSAILRSLDAIAEVDERIQASEELPSMKKTTSSESPAQLKISKREVVPHIIVLLTDGASNTGPSPLLAAQQAAERGVRIYPIGFGTTRSAIMDCWNLAGDAQPGSADLEAQPMSGSFGDGPDEVTLKQIAEITGGKFYSATSAAELQTVFQDLHSSLARTNKSIEVSVFFSAAGIFLAMAAFVLSLFWRPLL